MLWFKILLVGVLGFSVLGNLLAIRRGTQELKITPFDYAIRAILTLLFALGVWFLL